MFEYALASGLTASGADAYLLHVTLSLIHILNKEDGFDIYEFQFKDNNSSDVVSITERDQKNEN